MNNPVCVRPLQVFCLHCVWSTMYVHIDRFTFLIIYHWPCYWVSLQVVNVFLVGPVQLFPFLWFPWSSNILIVNYIKRVLISP